MTDWRPPWAPGAVTGLGPLPGTDAREAARLVFGELPDLPHLAELPGRGAGADPVGRTAAQLVGLHVDLLAGRWRVVPGRSNDERRAAELLDRDLDALEEFGDRHPGPAKVQLVGPWTLAATLELVRGEKVLVDPGATRDLAASLAETVARHVAEVRRRLPRVERLLVQLDEPLLPAVLARAVPSASGWNRMPAPEQGPAEQVLAEVLAAAGDDAGVHCNVAGAPIALLRRAGARFVAAGPAVLATVPEEDVGEAVEAGTGLLVGLVPAPPGSGAPVRTLAAPARRLWGRLGFGDEHWAGVVVTPAADLAAVGPEEALAVLRRCHDVARSFLPPDDERPPEE